MNSIPQIILKPRKALPFFSGHPWVFTGAILQEPQGLSPGQEVLVLSDQKQPIARGLYNPHSNIRVRLYSWKLDQPVDHNFWRETISRAIKRRDLILGNNADPSGRLIFSEGDGISGLTVDRFGSWLVVQLTSLALHIHLETILDLLMELCQPRGIILRTEKGMVEEEQLVISDGLVRGEIPTEPIVISQQGIKYQVDLEIGQKTGFYFDQRENRVQAARYAPAGRLLDVCCYSGGFSLHALLQGRVTQAVCVDSSPHALELVTRNAELNQCVDRIQLLKGRSNEVMQDLHQQGQQFSTVILDPPKMARQRSGISKAIHGYTQLNRQAIRLVEQGGLLVTCSCSGIVGQEEFLNAVFQAGLQEKRTLRLIDLQWQSADHPINLACRESAYLKCAYVIVD